MSFKSLKNLALAAALAVSAAGLFPDSALARRARYSGISDGGDAEFFIDSNKNDNLSEAVRDISFRTGEGIFFESSIGSIDNRILLNTPEELNNFLSDSGLSSFFVGRDNIFAFNTDREEPVVAYVINLSNDLVPNDEATLTLFYDDEAPEPNLSLTDLENLTTSLDGLVAFEEVSITGFLVRNRRDFPDRVQPLDGLVIDRLTFRAEKVPEPTTTAGLFIVGAFGGLSMLKRNRRVNKSKAMVEN
ncbi:MAG: PEP-CTERM sorting domain-containing protein [Rivularia sp. (in: cyanobacteria)]